MELDGKQYLVGEKATKGGNHLWGLDSLIKYAPLFLKYLKQEKNEDISEVVIAIPTKTFALAVKAANAGRESFFDKMSKRINDIIPETKVYFLPQGVSAIYYYKEKGEIKKGDSVLTLDGGFNTLNIAITQVKDSLDILYQESVFDKGIRTLLVDKFLPLLQSEIAEDIPKEYHFLKKIFLKKEIDLSLKTISLENQVEIAVKSYLDEVMDYILNAIQRETDAEYNVINVVGGLSYYLQINSNKKVLIPQRNGEFLTAIGMATKYKNALALDLGFGDIKVARYTG